MKFKAAQLEERLRTLRQRSPDVMGSEIVSMEGLPIAGDLPTSLSDEDRLAAESAAMLLLGERVAGELGRGDLQTILMTGPNGHVIVATINERAALTVLCRQEARLAMVFLDIAYCTEGLAELL